MSTFSRILRISVVLATALLSSFTYATANDGQPELIIYNNQGSAPVTNIAYWLTDNTGNIDCQGTQAKGVPIALQTHETTIFATDMSPACQAAKPSAYVLHVQGDFITGSWPYTAYPKSGQSCTVEHDYTSWPFTTIKLSCQ